MPVGEGNCYQILSRYECLNGLLTMESRVGEAGQIKTVDFSSLDDAKVEYEKRFKSKTGLAWENRMDDPKANKYTFVEKAYEDEAESDNDAVASDEDAKKAESQLDLPTQRLMELIFKYEHHSMLPLLYRV